MADDWLQMVSIGAGFTDGQRTRITYFFRRLSSTPAGRLIMAELDRRTRASYQIGRFTIPFTEHRDNLLTLIGKDLDGDTLGQFAPGTSRIEIDPGAFVNHGTTQNLDGSAYRFEQVLLHEIVHYLLDDNAGFNMGGSQYTLGGLVTAAGSAANSAYIDGRISRQTLEYILAPYREGVRDGEQITNIISK